MADYDRFTDEPRFAEAFTAAYRGRHHPMDAVWWVEHPHSTSPRGTPSAALDLARLKAAAYSRSGGVEGRTALVLLEKQLDADRQSTLAALRVALSEVSAEQSSARAVASVGSGSPAAQMISGATGAVDTAGASGFVGSAGTPAPAQPAAVAELPRGHERRRLIGVAAIVLISIGIGIGIGAGLGNGNTAVDTVARSGAAQSMGALPGRSPSQWGNKPPKMLDVFDQAQDARDIPPPRAFGPALIADTFRLLRTSTGVTPGGIFAGATYSVYVAQNTAGSPCLLLIAGTPSITAKSCVSVPKIPNEGISVYLRTPTESYSFVWATNGSIQGSFYPVAEENHS